MHSRSRRGPPANASARPAPPSVLVRHNNPVNYTTLAGGSTGKAQCWTHSSVRAKSGGGPHCARGWSSSRLDVSKLQAQPDALGGGGLGLGLGGGGEGLGGGGEGLGLGGGGRGLGGGGAGLGGGGEGLGRGGGGAGLGGGGEGLGLGGGGRGLGGGGLGLGGGGLGLGLGGGGGGVGSRNQVCGARGVGVEWRGGGECRQRPTHAQRQAISTSPTLRLTGSNWAKMDLPPVEITP